VDLRELSFITPDSPLARSQSQAVVDHIERHLPRLKCRIETLAETADDPHRDDEIFVATSRADGTKLARAISEGQARLFVIRAADMALPLPVELDVLCVPDRALPFDALLNRQGLIMDEMQEGARIGVMSMRCRRQMAGQWPDLRFDILRGGVDKSMETHLRKSEIDGLIIPAAVTEHLGIQGIVAEIFAPEFVLPSPGQGIIAIVGRRDDDEVRELLAAIHSPGTATELAAEQAFRTHMISDQDLPVGALARVDGDTVCIAGATGSGSQRVEIEGRLDEAEAVGAGLAQQILSSGQCFADLLEADFPDGLPDDDTDEADALDEDALILGALDHADDEPAKPADPGDLDDLDDLENLRAFENLAGIEDKETETDPDEEDYDDYN